MAKGYDGVSTGKGVKMILSGGGREGGGGRRLFCSFLDLRYSLSNDVTTLSQMHCLYYHV